jgi:hypothetical protein
VWLASGNIVAYVPFMSELPLVTFMGAPPQLLTLRRVFHEKFIVTQLVKKLPGLMTENGH